MNRAITRAVAAFKAFAMRFSGGSAGFTWAAFRGRSQIDYSSYVGDGTGNSAVMACVLWVCRAFPEAPLTVYRVKRDGTEEPIPGHPMAERIRRPNPYYSGRLLWMATLVDWLISGNAYWIKVRNGDGMPVELWYAPAALVEPKWPGDGRTFISHYEYRPGGLNSSLGEAIKLPPSEVVHFRYGIDPANVRKGLSPLRVLLRSIFTDDEATSFAATVLHNLGVPGIIVTPANENVIIEQDEAEAMKANFIAKFTNDRRGEPMIVGAPVKIDRLSFSPAEMGGKELHRVPEERISAVLGVPAIVAGLGAGLDRSTFANYAEAREAGYEQGVMPTQALMADELDTQLLPDFDTGQGVRTGFDTSKVRVLQEDQDKLWIRVDRGIRGGWLRVDRGMSMLGMTPEDGDAYYLRSSTLVAVPGDDPLGETLRPDPATTSPGTDGDPNATDPDTDKGRQADTGVPEADDAQKASNGAVLSLATEGQQDNDIPTLPHPQHALSGGSTRSDGAPDDDAVTLISSDLSAEIYDELLALTRIAAERAEAYYGKSAAGGDGVHIEIKDAPLQLLLDTDFEDVRRVLRSYIVAAGRQAAADLSERTGLKLKATRATPAVRSAVGEMEARMPNVITTTNSDLTHILRTAERSPSKVSLEELRARILEHVENTYKGRADAIAVTELAYAYNEVTLGLLERSTTITQVDVVDGTDDEACAAANGQRWGLTFARVSKLAHPRCRRRFLPVVE